MLEYAWQLCMRDGDFIEQFDGAGEEVPFAQIDTSQVESASWISRNTVGPKEGHTVTLCEGQHLILLRRHEVGFGRPDKIVLYILGYWEENREEVLFIVPGKEPLWIEEDFPGGALQHRVQVDKESGILVDAGRC